MEEARRRSRDAAKLGTTPGRAYIHVGGSDGDRPAILDLVNPAMDRGDIVRMRLGTSEPFEKLVATPAERVLRRQ